MDPVTAAYMLGILLGKDVLVGVIKASTGKTVEEMGYCGAKSVLNMFSNDEEEVATTNMAQQIATLKKVIASLSEQDKAEVLKLLQPTN